MDPNQAQQLVQLNAAARAAVLANAVDAVQQLPAQAVNPTNQNVLTFQPKNVGLLKGFIVEVDGSIGNTGMTTAITPTNFATLNALTNIQFVDLNNVTRVNTTGYHLGLLNSARQGYGFGGAYAPNLPAKYGNNWSVQTAPSTIAAGANGTIRQIYWVPLVYSASDLRGGLYMGVTSAVASLQLTINPTPVIASGDQLNAVYTGNAGGWNGNVTVTVYQVFLDQLPVGKQGAPILPALDLSTVYELKQTTLTGMASGFDFPYSYANYRDFLSTVAIYDNAGVFNTGSDVNYWSLTAANSYQFFKVSPQIAALWARGVFMADPPAGAYYFDHRRKPIDTQNWGNINLNLNASAVTAGASMIVCTEAFSQVTQLLSAGSLNAG
jgi:hypothetical protein